MPPLLTDEESGRLRDIVRQGGMQNSLLLYDALGSIAARTHQNTALSKAINADLTAHGISKRIDVTKIWRARNWDNASEEDKADVRAKRKTFYDVVDPRNAHRGRTKAEQTAVQSLRGIKARLHRDESRRHLESQAQIRLLHAENLYRSMHNAPKGKVNLPLKQRVEEIQQRLDDIFEIPPETAVLGYGPELCRMFTPSRAEWWMKFCELNEARWKAEVPDLPPMPNRRSIPLAERDLSLTERAILDWLRKRTTAETPLGDAMSATEAAIAVHCSAVAARSSLTKLYNHDLAEMVGIVDGHKLYIAT